MRSTKEVWGTHLLSNTLWLSCLLSGVSNKSEKLFYPLTFLQLNSKWSTEHVRKNYFTFWYFYGLACYTKHWTSQDRLFNPVTLLRFSCLLCKTPHRSKKTFLPSDTFMVGIFIFSSVLDSNHRDRQITPTAMIGFYFACLIAWLANFIVELFQNFQSQRRLSIYKWSCQDEVFISEVGKYSWQMKLLGVTWQVTWPCHHIQRKRKNLRDMSCVNITVFWHFKKLGFCKNCENVFNVIV